MLIELPRIGEPRLHGTSGLLRRHKGALTWHVGRRHVPSLSLLGDSQIHGSLHLELLLPSVLSYMPRILSGSRVSFIASQVRLFLVLLFELVSFNGLIELIFLVVVHLILDALLVFVRGLELLRTLVLDDLDSIGKGDVVSLWALLPGPRHHRLLVAFLADVHSLLARLADLLRHFSVLSSDLLWHFFLISCLPPHFVISRNFWLPLLVLVVHWLKLADFLERLFICY